MANEVFLNNPDYVFCDYQNALTVTQYTVGFTNACASDNQYSTQHHSHLIPQGYSTAFPAPCTFGKYLVNPLNHTYADNISGSPPPHHWPDTPGDGDFLYAGEWQNHPLPDNFHHRFKIQLNQLEGGSGGFPTEFGIWSATRYVLGEGYGGYDENETYPIDDYYVPRYVLSFLGVRVFGGSPRLNLAAIWINPEPFEDAIWYYADDNSTGYVFTLGTAYYVDLVKDMNLGESGQVIIKLYSDEAYENLLHTFTLDIPDAPDQSWGEPQPLYGPVFIETVLNRRMTHASGVFGPLDLNYVEAQNINPTRLESSSVVFDPEVIPGAVTIEATRIDSSSIVYEPEVVLHIPTQTIEPERIESSAQVFEPEVTLEEVTPVAESAADCDPTLWGWDCGDPMLWGWFGDAVVQREVHKFKAPVFRRLSFRVETM